MDSIFPLFVMKYLSVYTQFGAFESIRPSYMMDPGQWLAGMAVTRTLYMDFLALSKMDSVTGSFGARSRTKRSSRRLYLFTKNALDIFEQLIRWFTLTWFR